jgi:hypothetical protein
VVESVDVAVQATPSIAGHLTDDLVDQSRVPLLALQRSPCAHFTRLDEPLSLPTDASRRPGEAGGGGTTVTRHA